MLCIDDENSENWYSYRGYIYVNGGERKYIDLDTCLTTGGRYAYLYWECSSLRPDNGEQPFKKIWTKNQVYSCDSYRLLALTDKVVCVHSDKCFSKYKRISV